MSLFLFSVFASPFHFLPQNRYAKSSRLIHHASCLRHPCHGPCLLFLWPLFLPCPSLQPGPWGLYTRAFELFVGPSLALVGSPRCKTNWKPPALSRMIHSNKHQIIEFWARAKGASCAGRLLFPLLTS